MTFKANLIRLHRAVGAAAGIPIVLLGLSGAALAVAPWADTQSVDTCAAPTSLQKVLDGARAAPIEARITLMLFPRAGAPYFELRTNLPDGTRLRVDPCSGELIWVLTSAHLLSATFEKFHTELFLGGVGSWLLALCGVLFLLQLVSGLAASLRRRETHVLLGQVAFLFLTLQVLTGVALQFHDGVRAILRPDELPPPPAIGNGRPLDLDEIVARANAALPDGRVTGVHFPVAPGDPIRVRKRIGELHAHGRSSIWLHPVSGDVLRVDDQRTHPVGARLDDAIHPVHGVSFLGAAGPLYHVVIGVVPLVLFVTGVRMKRRRGA